MAGENGLMKAVQYERCGKSSADALKHVEVPIPSPKKGEMLIKVEAASINPFDWKIQTGMMRPFVPSKLPCIPAMDVAGEVAKVGPDESNFSIGDKVVSFLRIPQSGGLAEYALAPTDRTVIISPELPAAEAAGLPLAATTALQALRAAGINKFDGTPTAGQPLNILVTAASGGVGHYAVQLAKLAGHHVTATCGPRNLEFAKGLGADEVLDYKTPDGVSLRSPSGKKYDVIIHCATSRIAWSTFEPNLSSKGVAIDLTPTFNSILYSILKRITFAKKQLITMYTNVNYQDIKFVAELARHGKLKTVVDSRHPLSKAEDAWAKSIDGHATGKIIIEM